MNTASIGGNSWVTVTINKGADDKELVREKALARNKSR
jgi:hypothetical protein